MHYKVIQVQSLNDRFVVTDRKGNVINDGNGHGYTSESNAHKAMLYLINNAPHLLKKPKTKKKKTKKGVRSVNLPTPIKQMFKEMRTEHKLTNPPNLP